MRTVILAAVLALTVGAGAWAADETIDAARVREAQERLNAKAAAQPTEVERLRKEVVELRAELAELKILYADRMAELKALRPQKVAAASRPALAKGMTFEEVGKILGPPNETSSADGKIVGATWYRHRMTAAIQGAPPSGPNSVLANVTRATFRDGVLTGWSETSR